MKSPQTPADLETVFLLLLHSHQVSVIPCLWLCSRCWYSLCLAKEAAVKQILILKIFIFPFLWYFPYFLPLISISTKSEIQHVGRQLLGGLLNTTLLRSGLSAFSTYLCCLSVGLSSWQWAQSLHPLIFFICVFSCLATCSCKKDIITAVKILLSV